MHPSASFGSPYLNFGARQYDPEVATWLAPDPLSTDYPSLSPYVYCAGDPVNLVDPEGSSIRILKEQARALKDLARIVAIQKGRQILSTISRKNEIGLPFEPEYRLQPVFFRGNAGFTGSEINYLRNPWFRVGGGSADEFVLMGHEISHAYDHHQKGLVMKDGKATSGRVSSESKAVTFENYLRSVFGIDKLRTSYSGLNGHPDFNPVTKHYSLESISGFSLLNGDEQGTRLGYSYTSAIGDQVQTLFLVVGVDDQNYFYFDVYENEEEYRKAAGW